MASQSLSQKNAFCVTWIVENMDYSLSGWSGRNESPEFVVDTMEKTKWCLNVLPLPRSGTVECWLHRVKGREGPPNIEVEFQFELLTVDGSTLTSDVEKRSFKKLDLSSTLCKPIFKINKSTFLPDGKLTVRCTMRKSNSFMETTTCLARTIIGVKRRSFNWKFSYYNLLMAEKLTYRIEPASEDEIDITLHLSLLSIEKVHFEKISSSPNDDLTLECEGAYSTKITHHQIENIGQSHDSRRTEERLHPSVTENALPEPLNTLKDHLSSLHRESFLSDVKLKTNTSTYPAHKAVLSARSPVFKAMFLTEMKEKSGQCVEIPDMDEETVRLMLQFMYTADLPDLRWSTACRLYQAADKYEILSLKKTCSSFLVSNLSVTNACELLALFDKHQDADQKQAVQEFMLKQDAEFFRSDEWKEFMESNLKLAADTMVLKLQK
ncbi:TD and POZ domain-containing protein 1 [Caerostris extrusa]|uniref:TD and POZ domain-containing protein 1 n=1 Tax=Caerostris extrusa TaxID=172846 RepID=A0AAV4X3H8_CAEEX|nr:TD and POZ domain-containing protein 1 [Caerostris extrusa]